MHYTRYSFSFADLEWYIYRNCQVRGTKDVRRGCDRIVTDTDIARILGVNRYTVIRWRHGRTGISKVFAERIADRLDALPSEIWGDAYNEAERRQVALRKRTQSRAHDAARQRRLQSRYAHLPSHGPVQQPHG